MIRSIYIITNTGIDMHIQTPTHTYTHIHTQIHIHTNGYTDIHKRTSDHTHTEIHAQVACLKVPANAIYAIINVIFIKNYYKTNLF